MQNLENNSGFTKTIIAYREKYFYTKLAQLIREWVMSCEQCLRETRIKPRLAHPPLQNPNEYITAPEDAMQIDLLPRLAQSGGYENIMTAMDMFSAIYLHTRHLIRTPKQSPKFFLTS